jgi:hypothetical protein
VRVISENWGNMRACIDKATTDFHGFVCGYSTGYTKNNVASAN